MKTTTNKIQLISLLRGICQQTKKRLDNDLKEENVSSTQQYSVLRFIKNGEKTQKEIADYILSDEASTTRILDRMIKKGLIHKKNSHLDKRKNYISLSDMGKKSIKRIESIERKNNQFVEELLTPEELNLIMPILVKLDTKIRSD